jgi:four helix bundle protein
MAYQSFEELEVWKWACRLAVEINKLLAERRQYALKDQIVRASISVPSNIAEGCERDSKPDFIRFLRIAKGSAAELRTQLYIALRLEMLSPAQAEPLIQESREISAMLQGLIRSLARGAVSEH